MNLNGRLTSGKLATHAGVSPDTIRHYERLGILPSAVRTASGYRIFTAEAAERVVAVQRALRVGYTLAELAEIFRVRDSGAAPCRRAYGLAQEKLTRVRADIEALKETERYLSKMLVDWKKKMRKAGPGQKAFLLSSLEARPAVDKNKMFRRDTK
jgi:DNA-binding transcriptional MerR regulator